MHAKLSSVEGLCSSLLESIHTNTIISSPQSIRRRFIRGIGWSLISAVVSQSSGLLMWIMAARLLGKEAFGELGMIQSTIGMLGTFAGLGLGLTATKYVSEFRSADPLLAQKVIALSFEVALFSSTLCCFGLFAYAPYLANTFHAPHLVLALRISSGLLFFNALAGAQTGVLSGLESFIVISKKSLITGIIQFPIMAVAVYFGRLHGAVWALVIIAGLALVINHGYLHSAARAVGIEVHYFSRHLDWRILWNFSLPAFLSNLVMGPATWVANTMLVNQPGGFGEMGLFNAANQWRSAILFLPTVIGQVVLPLTSSLQGGSDRQSIRRVLLAAMVTSAGCALPTLVFLSMFSNQIMSWYGKGFDRHGSVLVLTAGTAFLLALMTPVGNIIVATGRMWLAAAMNAGLGLVLVCSASYFLQQHMGAKGIAAAYLVAYLAHASWTFWFALVVLSSGSKKLKLKCAEEAVEVFGYE
jgi:O-antigen/teichoic acid export membrane protein